MSKTPLIMICINSLTKRDEVLKSNKIILNEISLCDIRGG